MALRRAVLFGVFAVLLAACGGDTTIGSAKAQLDVSAQYLVRYDDGLPAGFAAQVAALGGTVDYSHSAGFAIVSGLSADDAATLGAEEVVANASHKLTTTTSNATASAATPQSPSNPAGAFFYPYQWNMRAVHADKAWARGRVGSASVKVAVLDTGIDYRHFDLQGRVDLSRSVSFLPPDDALVAAFFPSRHPVTDLHYHGTHVAATIASNGWVAAGVTSKTTLIGVKVCSVYDSIACPFGAIFAGIMHSVDAGADVVNMSLGGAFDKAQAKGFGGFLNMVGNYARSKGVTIVVAAGNENKDMQHDGSDYNSFCDTPATVCVSATAPASSAGHAGPFTGIDTPAPYTNYGNRINVAAPGGWLSGWIWAACSSSSLVVPPCQASPGYIVGLAGTSMATPHVAGLAALVVEDVGRNPARVKAAIEKGADDLGPNGSDAFYGQGRINVNASAK